MSRQRHFFYLGCTMNDTPRLCSMFYLFRLLVLVWTGDAKAAGVGCVDFLLMLASKPIPTQ